MMGRLFVYGTLLARLRPARECRLLQTATCVGRGVVQGQLFDLGRYPGLLPSTGPRDQVVGEVYRFAPGTEETLLSALDDYEGISARHPQPHEYVRQVVAVRLDDGSTLEAWAYLLASGRPQGARIASGDYAAWRGAPDSAPASPPESGGDETRSLRRGPTAGV